MAKTQTAAPAGRSREAIAKDLFQFRAELGRFKNAAARKSANQEKHLAHVDYLKAAIAKLEAEQHDAAAAE